MRTVFSHNLDEHPGKLKALAQQSRCLILFGPNEGLIRHYTLDLCSQIDSNPLTLAAVDVLSDPSILRRSLDNLSLFDAPTDRMVIVRGAGDRMVKLLDSVIDDDLRQSCDDLIVLQAAPSISRTSSLVRWGESKPVVAVVSCLNDDPPHIVRQLLAGVNREKPYLSSEAANMAASLIEGDRGVVLNERDKLIAYSQHRPDSVLDEKTVREIVADTAQHSVFDLIDAVCVGNIRQAASLQRAVGETANEVAVLRMLAGHFLNIRRVQEQLAKGASLSEALRSLDRPLFFRRKAAFGHSCKILSSATVARSLLAVARLESQIKRGVAGDSTLAVRHLLVHLTIQIQGRSAIRPVGSLPS